MPRKMTKKERKWIADMAKRLPEIPCKEIKIVTGLEIMCKEEYAHLRNRPHIDALKKYKLRVGAGTIQKLSHKRELERQYEKGGAEAVRDYLDKYLKPKP